MLKKKIFMAIVVVSVLISSTTIYAATKRMSYKDTNYDMTYHCELEFKKGISWWNTVGGSFRLYGDNGSNTATEIKVEIKDGNGKELFTPTICNWYSGVINRTWSDKKNFFMTYGAKYKLYAEDGHVDSIELNY